jgi:hypothetical protein
MVRTPGPNGREFQQFQGGMSDGDLHVGKELTM